MPASAVIATERPRPWRADVQLASRPAISASRPTSSPRLGVTDGPTARKPSAR